MTTIKEMTLSALQELIDISYEDGRRGVNEAYPLDADKQLSDYEKECGRNIDSIAPITRKIIAAMNAAYEHGRNEADGCLKAAMPASLRQ